MRNENITPTTRINNCTRFTLIGQSEKLNDEKNHFWILRGKRTFIDLVTTKEYNKYKDIVLKKKIILSFDERIIDSLDLMFLFS